MSRFDRPAARFARTPTTSTCDDSRVVILDLTGRTRIDSVELTALIAAQRSAAALGRRFVVVTRATRVRRVLEIMRLTEVMDIVPTVDVALRCCENAGSRPAARTARGASSRATRGAGAVPARRGDVAAVLHRDRHANGEGPLRQSAQVDARA